MDWLDLQGKTQIVKRKFLKSNGLPKATTNFSGDGGTDHAAHAETVIGDEKRKSFYQSATETMPEYSLMQA